MKYNTLFSEYVLNGQKLNNRFLMAPMTRSRSTQPGGIPNKLMAEYYGQRASAGVIITEATQVSMQGMGYAKTPGIYTQEQIEGWKLVTNEVHKKGSRIYLQLWHVGRVSSSKVNGLQPIAPSPIAAKETSVYIFDGASNGDVTFVPVEEPREMTYDDIEQVIKEFTQGAKNAMEAGFDGVEIHGANGYLIDQFLRSNANKRTDEYGGCKENRIRLLLEITQSVVDAIGKENVGVRLSPFISFKDMNDPEILETIMVASEKLEEIGVTYIHLCEADWDDAPEIPNDFRVTLRKTFSNTIIATGNKTPEEGEDLLKKELVDLIGFGRKFLTNPDYPKRVELNSEMNEILGDGHTLFGGGDARGYTDYPFLKYYSMNPIEKKLKELKLELPTPKPGVGAYKSWTIFADNIVCTSGQIPWKGEKVAYTGRLGDEVTIEQGIQSAQLCALHAIAQLKEATNGNLNKIKQIIRIEGSIYTAPNFSEHAQVLNGASNLFNEVFGEKGRHTRTAQGMNTSPLNASTLIYVFAEIDKSS